MTVYFQMNEINDVAFKTVNNVIHKGSGYDTNNARGAIGVTESSDTTGYFDSPAFSATDFWIHMATHNPTFGVLGVTADKSMLRIMSGGNPKFRITPVDSNGIQIDRWSGSAWVTLASGTLSGMFGANVRSVIDIHVEYGVAATITVYVNNTLIAVATNVDTTFSGTVTSYDLCRFGCPNNSSTGVEFGFSEIICADWNTIGSKLVTRIPDANGNYAEWTSGDYTIVDEVTGGIDYATSPIADQRVDWSMSSFPALTGNLVVASVQINATINRDTTGPQAANFYVRQGSTDYDDVDQALNVTQTSTRKQYPVDPSTGTTWSIANINSATYGIRSRS